MKRDDTKPNITVVGIGSGDKKDITPATTEALIQADVVIGYAPYFKYIEHLLSKDVLCVSTGMHREEDRARKAFEFAEKGLSVVVISSGDAAIYGMTSLVYEMGKELESHVKISSCAGISAFQKAAELLGAPLGHDLCLISLSNILTPWETIEKRIRAAAQGDFIVAVYNPCSKERFWQLERLREVFLNEGRSADTPVGIVHQAGREGEQIVLTTLQNMNSEKVDMFSVVIIGNSQSYIHDNTFITPRGYFKKDNMSQMEHLSVGQSIMQESFRTIEKELTNRNLSMGHYWALLHAIHTTADFDMQRLLYCDPFCVEALHSEIKNKQIKMIITDVTMVVSGVRKASLQRFGVEIKCYLNDKRTEILAQQNSITRTQAGIRLAVLEHPEALFVFGNAPTALMELCKLIQQGKANPSGVIAAPVGFVHVKESKYMLKHFHSIPKIIIQGRKGGSNIAATLVNAVLTYDDAESFFPGRDL